MSKNDPTAPREVALFRNNRSQAVRIPREFELPGEKALIRREHGRLIVEPVKPPSLIELLDGWEPIAEELPGIDDPPPGLVDDPAHAPTTATG